MATRQHGVIALWQIDGFTARVAHRGAAAGRLHRLYPGVYAVGHRNLTQKGRWTAAVLSAGPQAVLSHSAALSLWDLRRAPGGPVDVTVPARGRRSRAGVRIHCVRALDPRETTRREWIPVTSLPRTLLDYAEVAGPQWLRLALEEAERRDLLDGRALERTLARHPGRHGRAKLREALGAITGPAPWTQSEFERQFLVLVREAGLPEPRMNVLIDGELVDAYWPAANLVVELDGYLFHRTRREFDRDRRRDARLALLGLTVIRLTQPRVQFERRDVAGELRALIARAA